MARTSRRILWTVATLLSVLATAAPVLAVSDVTLRQGETWRIYDPAGTETARFTVTMVDPASGAAAYTTFDLAAGTEGAPTETTIGEAKKAVETAMAGAGSVERGYYLDQNGITFAAAEPFEVPKVLESPTGESAEGGTAGGGGAVASGGPAPGAGGPKAGGPEGGPGGPGGAPGGPGGPGGAPGATPGGPEGPGGPGGPGAGAAPEEGKSSLPLPLPVLGGIGLVVVAGIVFAIVKLTRKR